MTVRYAVMFPGQGSQYVGMGEDIYNQYEEVKSLYNIGDAITGKNLKDIIFNGPIEKLTSTHNAQISILLNSISLYNIFLQRLKMKPSYVCGNSAGEYSALYASSVLTFKETISLINIRGLLMSSINKGSMLAIQGLNEGEIKDLCTKVVEEGEYLGPSNWNSGSEAVISGNSYSIMKANALLKQLKIPNIKLNVSGAFHSPLMIPASLQFKKFLHRYEFKKAKIPIFSNVNAEIVEQEKEWNQLLERQINSTVMWKQIVSKIINEGIDVFVEIGPGSILSRLLKKDFPQIKVITINDISSLQTAVETLNGYKLTEEKRSDANYY